VDAESKVSIRPVVIAASDAERSLVGSGVEPGERVVLEGSDRLRDGGKVEVIDDDASATEPGSERSTQDRPLRNGA
jgi:membrane fusion protein, multidrug efflux system